MERWDTMLQLSSTYACTHIMNTMLWAMWEVVIIDSSLHNNVLSNNRPNPCHSQLRKHIVHDSMLFVQELHKQGWQTCNKFAAGKFPIVGAKFTQDLSYNIPALNDELDRIGQEIGDGTRRREWEFYIFWANLTTFGVLTGTQSSWLQSFLRAYLGQGHFKNRSCAVILAPNRACDLTSTKKEEDDNDDDEPASEDDTQEETEASIRAVFAQTTQALEQADLIVKDFRITFADSSVFGKRKQYHDGLILSHKGDNIFHNSKLWRRRLVEQVEMMPRSKARKPKPLVKGLAGDSQTRSKISAMRSLETMTPVQVKKQECGYASKSSQALHFTIATLDTTSQTH